MTLIKKALLLILLLVVATVGVAYYVSHRFSNFSHSFIASNDCKVWSHRGIVADSLIENTIEAFAYAKQHGVTGIELDVFWIDSLQSCVVMHDLDTTANLRKALSLEKVCATFKDSLDYWVDFKNLNTSNAKNALIYFKRLITEVKLPNHLYIESGDPNALAQLKTDGLYTLFWIQFNRKNRVKKYLKSKWIQYKIAKHQFDGYTIASAYYDNTYQELFGQLPTYVFHGSYERYQEFCNQEGLNVKAVLVDQDYYR